MEHTPQFPQDAACKPDELYDNLVEAMRQPGSAKGDEHAYTLAEVESFVGKYSYTDLADMFYPNPEEKMTLSIAKRVCGQCAVRSECAQVGLEPGKNAQPKEAFGVWGGLSEQERKAVVRRRNKQPSQTDTAA